MKDAYFQDELEWLLEGLIGDNLCCKLMLETMFINIPLNGKKVMSDDRNLSGKKKYAICQQVQILSTTAMCVQLC